MGRLDGCTGILAPLTNPTRKDNDMSESATTTEPSSNVTLHGGQPKRDTKTIAPKKQTPRTDDTSTIIRFYESDRAGGPRFVGEIDVPGMFGGMVIKAQIWARESPDGITWTCRLPGDRYGNHFYARPKIVMDAKGNEIPVAKTRCDDGRRIEENWQPAILTAFNAFVKTKNNVQLVRF